MMLEVYEVEVRQEWPSEPHRVVPAAWWCHIARGAWVGVGRIGLCGLFRLLLYRERSYWPIRITLCGRVLWRSGAARIVPQD